MESTEPSAENLCVSRFFAPTNPMKHPLSEPLSDKTGIEKFLSQASRSKRARTEEPVLLSTANRPGAVQVEAKMTPESEVYVRSLVAQNKQTLVPGQKRAPSRKIVVEVSIHACDNKGELILKETTTISLWPVYNGAGRFRSVMCAVISD